MVRPFLFCLAVAAMSQLRLAGQIQVVNMVPLSNSGEKFQDSEPSLALNPANPVQMAATAVTTDPRCGGKGPVYLSVDGGSTWSIVTMVPNVQGSPFPYVDATVSFGINNTLYAAILK